jgi:hypothetical protein
MFALSIEEVSGETIFWGAMLNEKHMLIAGTPLSWTQFLGGAGLGLL